MFVNSIFAGLLLSKTECNPLATKLATYSLHLASTSSPALIFSGKGEHAMEDQLISALNSGGFVCESRSDHSRGCQQGDSFSLCYGHLFTQTFPIEQ